MLGVPSFPAQNSPQRQNDKKKSRNKVSLKPGRSLMDWIKLANSERDIQGFKGKIAPITLEELRKHNTEEDCWIAIHGQVFNITSYLEYHPGGVEELMKGAGIDATDIFDEVHKWVNYASMLAKCYIGPLKQESTVVAKRKASKTAKTNDGFLAPSGILPTKPSEVMPRYDWYSKNDAIVLFIYTKSKVVYPSDVILGCQDGKILNVKVLFGKRYYRIHLELTSNIKDATVESVVGNKINIILHKQNSTDNWNVLGKGLEGHNAMHDDKDRDLVFRDCSISTIENVTHDTKLFTIDLPQSVCYQSPVGHHVIIKDTVEGMEVRRNYTVALSNLITDTTTMIGRQLHLMIKCYSDGVLTSILNNKKVGDKLSMSDCTGNFERSQLENKKQLFLIAAGTGFTPMIRLIHHYFTSEQNKVCKISLLFANKEENDVLWKDQLDNLMETQKDRFKVTYILSRPSSKWTGLTGRINQETLQAFLYKHETLNLQTTDDTASTSPVMGGVEGSEDSLYAICGPDQFTESINSILLDIGIKEETIHCFLG